VDALLTPLVKSRPFKELLRSVDDGPTVGGVTGSALSLLAVALALNTTRRLVVLVPGEQEAEGTVDDLRLLGLAGQRVASLPPGVDGGMERARVIDRLSQDQRLQVLVTPARSAVDPLPRPDAIKASRLRLTVGEVLGLEEVVERLGEAGFTRETVVDRAGTFAVRGDLIDFWSHDRGKPLRVEWLDDEIEGIRAFDPATQLSVEVLAEAAPSLMAPDTSAESGPLADHLSDDWVVLARDARALQESMERHLSRFQGADRERREDAWAALFRLPEIMTSRLKVPAGEALNLGGQIIAAAGTAFEDAMEALERVSRGKQATLLCFDTEAEQDRFKGVLEQQTSALAEKLRKRPVIMHVGRLREGFHSPFLGVAALMHHELFATTVTRRRPAQEDAVVSEAIQSFLDLDEGDYVVHLGHGISQFEGLRRETKGGAEQDFLVLRFRDDVKLHVPASKVDLVQKYIGGKGDAPDLSRLGSASWEKRKDAVRRAVADMAAELLELQAIRARKSGIRHPADTAWQQEFEAAFPHEATPDQARAADAIKADMESPQPMDRLICGDVGYGKTEVAMRAAFKCVMGNRQVAVLVPTTVLAQQHLGSFRERMKDYPVVIEGLSRFRTKAQQKRALEGLADGSVDVVIGTHRLLQGDVSFKDLGLLVIDEEQRFGVADKERLRRLRTNVDVLTMSATPIPRTLHQSILGIRDISPLGQAPRGRREVQTEVLPYAEGVVRTAVLRELDREGQVFFVHNRVQTIHKVAARLSKLVPEASILVGHGQMPERALERTMVSFLQHDADILVATTIIESGLDIPRVNTIFVDQAEMYGLSDLHQLRGRVGRHHHQAFAYFLVRPDRSISEIAEKRLRAIEEFSRLGAGFQIAMRDMEIRGAGNILGPEQSGHIASVGYEMYCRLLDNAVKGLRNQRVDDPVEVEINIDFTAYLDDTWITDRTLRIEMYRKLGRARTEAQFQAAVEELGDRFGPPPPVAREFVLVARIRALMERARVRRLEIMPGEGVALRAGRLKRLLSMIRANPEDVRVLRGEVVLLVRREPFEGPGELLGFLESRVCPQDPGGR